MKRLMLILTILVIIVCVYYIQYTKEVEKYKSTEEIIRKISTNKTYSISKTLIWGQTGFSQFSENPQKRTWFTRVDAGSNDVYLWSFGDGGPKWTFGAARPTNDERP
jgi:hypothetical protein